MNRKKIKKSYYLAALSITICIFLFGYLLGSHINNLKLQQIYDLEHEIRISSLSNELALELLSQDSCNSAAAGVYAEETAELGRKLTYMESIYGYDSPQVKNLKSYYSLLLLRSYLIDQESLNVCGGNSSQILFFYSNYIDCDDCEKQGLLLTDLYNSGYPLKVYSFEFAESNAALNLLKIKFNISEDNLPVLVINDQVLGGFQSKSEILKQLSN